MTLNVGIVDDPVKDRQAANSKTTRDSTWDWFTDVYLPRFDQHAGLLVIMTRWHVDDLLGRMLERDSKLKVLRYPAIAERDTHHHVWEPAPTPCWVGSWDYGAINRIPVLNRTPVLRGFCQVPHSLADARREILLGRLALRDRRASQLQR